MPRKGRQLEKLIEAIENSISYKDIIIESPAFIKDRITGQKREIDVLLSSGKGHHKQTIAFECKEWTKKVGTPEVEAFITKIKDLKLNKAIMVSANGFSSSAIEKARFYNISCLKIEEVEKFNWLQTDEVIKIHQHIIKNEWQINTNDKSIKNVTSSKIILSTGIEFTQELMSHNAYQYIKSLDFNKLKAGEIYKHLVHFNASDFFIIDTDSKKQYQATECILNLEFELKKEIFPIRNVKYDDVTEKDEIIKVAAAEIKIDKDNAGFFLFSENEDGTKKIAFTKQSNPKS